MKLFYRLGQGLALSLVLASLGACASQPKSAGVANDGGFLGLGNNSAAKAKKADAQNAIGVNAYLWRATLDTVSFMSLRSADPWGGVVITEWYADPQKPDERFKIDVYIMDSRLRADALAVSVFKEVLVGEQWQKADVSAQTQADIENTILTRARELRSSNIN